MPRELITVSVGQAGNQIGQRFWEMAVKEHAAANTDGLFDDSMSSFFRNVDASGAEVPAGRPGHPPPPIVDLRARAVLVDMEESVVASALKGPLGELFDSRQLLTDVSGSGNNWGHGYGHYGPQYRDSLSNIIASQAEACDSLQGFMLLHSLGGGTGSGLGSYILQLLEDEYPEAQRFNTSVFPSADDDVVTSPYNSLLSLSRLAQHADCVLPVDNAALQGMAAALEARGSRAGQCRLGAPGVGGPGVGQKPYDAMNSLAASMLLHLTSSVRFEGQLNLDLNEVVTNLVPYPHLHFILPSMAPLAAPASATPHSLPGRQATAPAATAVARGIDQAFMEVLQPGNQLVKLQPKQYTYLACGLIMRGGGAAAADFDRNIARMRQHIRLPPWNQDGFKTGICSRPPNGSPFSLLCLANNCGMGAAIAAMQQRFQQLYRRKLYTHHYQQYIELAEFDAALEVVEWLADSYSQLNDCSKPPNLAQLRPQEAARGYNNCGLGGNSGMQPLAALVPEGAGVVAQWR